MKPEYFTSGRTHILYDADALNQISDNYFTLSGWQQRQGLDGIACGRGATVFVHDERGEYVLRHYRRGGFVAKLIRDCYLWTGLEQSRPWREWTLLEQLSEEGLPVPAPIAVRLKRRGPCYTADILMSRIHAPSVGQRLLAAPLKSDTWEAIGGCIRRFHDRGVYHADLNAHNILLADENKVSVIDFDRGELRGEGRWKQANLERLQRSLRKLASIHVGFNYRESDWDLLMAAYSR
jgi:3-deoxy-D-manno-octulosonic acid kinase